MNIEVKQNHYYTTVIVTADNVNIAEDITKSFFKQDENGKQVFSHRDIEDSALQQFSQVLEDLFYYRTADYDSTTMIEQAFAKLPEDSAKKLLDELNRNYGE